MKSIKILAASIILAALAACGGQAKAADLTSNFVASDGAVFQTANAVSVEKISGSVAVTFLNSTTLLFSDSTGAVFNKVLADPTFKARFVRVGASNKYLNVAITSQLFCDGSSRTVLAYPYSTLSVLYLDDGCQFWQSVKAVSN